jgi:hypothetical protein
MVLFISIIDMFSSRNGELRFIFVDCCGFYCSYCDCLSGMTEPPPVVAAEVPADDFVAKLRRVLIISFFLQLRIREMVLFA